jgi:hypothetical protein
MLKSRNTSQRTKHPPLGVDSILHTRTYLAFETNIDRGAQSPIYQRGSVWCGVYRRLKSRLVNHETNDPSQNESQYVQRSFYMIFYSPSIRTSWATPWRVHEASLNGTCLTQSRADRRHLVSRYTSPSYPDFIVVISLRSRELAMPRRQISLAVDGVRPMTKPVQDQPSPPDMRLQAKVLASNSEQR